MRCMLDSSSVWGMYDNSTVQAMQNGSMVWEMHENSTVQTMCDRSEVLAMYDASAVREMSGSSIARSFQSHGKVQVRTPDNVYDAVLTGCKNR